MGKKRKLYPRQVLKNLVDDIKKLINTNEGRLFLLEIVEEIPYYIRNQVLEELSSFYEKGMMDFFYLLKLEYGGEMKYLYSKVLWKYSMAGIDTAPCRFFDGSFYKAYASCSRHTGRIALDVAWETGDKGVHVECFYLTFGPEGIHSFFVIEDMSLERYEKERRLLTDMVEVSFEEACFLISQSYDFNVRSMSRPASGKFLYQKYLDKKTAFDEEQQKKMLRKLSSKLTPRQLVNSFFYGLKRKDFHYASALTAGAESQRRVSGAFDKIASSEAVFLEGQVEEVRGSFETAQVTAYSLTVEEQQFYYNEYCFFLEKDGSGSWLISDLEKVKREAVSFNSELSPFSKQVFCSVYEIISLDELVNILNNLESIREIEELPCGVHMRVTYYEDNFNHGVSFFTGIIADLVINGDEFVVIAREHAVLREFHELLTNTGDLPVISRGEYKVNLLTAYSYMEGQYVNFEDVLLDKENEDVSEDGVLRLVTARYLIKDVHQVRQRIESLKTIEVEIPGEYRVYYRLDEKSAEPGFFVEYIMGPNWVTLSTFGDQDMAVARKEFEDGIYECLEFDGMEIREGGLFNVLTSQVKKYYPDLESTLKEVYLNKWYYSRLATLQGMSPCEACQTEEGTRLLWTMFKKIREKEKKKYFRKGKSTINSINLREYMRILERKKEEKH